MSYTAHTRSVSQDHGSAPRSIIALCAFLSITRILTISFMSFLRANSITGGLVKGALSVAASAYKALFTGQTGSEKVSLMGLSTS